MKPQKAKKFQPPKARHHRALFDDELPFQPKVEKRKDLYQRKPKYVQNLKSLDDDE
jgi:hypothetical protein